MSKILTTALRSAIKALTELPPAPTFNAEPIRAAFVASGLPESFIASALKESEKKHAATHGNTEENAVKAILSALSEAITGGEGGIAQLSLICGRMATEARKAGKVNVTASEWSLALANDAKANPAHVALLEQAKALRAAGKPWSDMETTMNLSESTRQALYVTVKDHARKAEFAPATTAA